uniref:LisH domain-containing protein n=1 Tax=Glossina brevipalpis TaxID=37001 RepID=A0A1A9W489_9MUSC
MSRQVLTKEEAINRLYSTIKMKFEEDGVLQEVRCLLQAKMVAMMRGKGEGALVKRPFGKDAAQDSRIALLNQLIMEYFHWHNYQYTAEMFGLESSAENSKPMRECLEGVLGSFQHKNVPILLEVVTELMQKQNKKK